jgi:hypothetical protein
MGAGRIAVICGLLCAVIAFHVSDAVSQSTGSSEINILGASPNQWSAISGSACRKDTWAAASLHVGWMTTPQRIHLGYDGRVLPGACVSSYFVYPLDGIEVGGSLPIQLAEQYAVRVYGSYFFTDTPQAGQELTWTNNPPGTREWQHSKSQWYKAGAEALYQLSGETALVAGFRWESLLTNFSEPNPDYLFTISQMEAQTTVSIYEPYVGIRLQQPGPGGLSFQCVGFPFLFATVEHLNVCNNGGVPFAHTGRKNATRGFFAEVSVAYRVELSRGVDAAAFVDWNVYQGQCPMTIERHEGGPNPAVTSGAVNWSHRISSLVIGAKVETSWNLPSWPSL